MLSFSIQQRQELRQRLSLRQRLILRMKITPQTECPQCHYRINPDHDHPWSEDPYDIEMRCPECQYRFVAQLRVEPMPDADSPSVRIEPREYAYLCEAQTIQALLDIRSKRLPRTFPGMEWLHNHRPEVFYSAVRHYGDLTPAITAARERAAA